MGIVGASMKGRRQSAVAKAIRLRETATARRDDATRWRDCAAVRGLGGPIYAFLRNEPELFGRDFLHNHPISKCLCWNTRKIGGFVSEKRTQIWGSVVGSVAAETTSRRLVRLGFGKTNPLLGDVGMIAASKPLALRTKLANVPVVMSGQKSDGRPGL